MKVNTFETRHGHMASAMRNDQEDAIKEREDLRDQLDDRRANSMMRKSSIKKSLNAESLKRSAMSEEEEQESQI